MEAGQNASSWQFETINFLIAAHICLPRCIHLSATWVSNDVVVYGGRFIFDHHLGFLSLSVWGWGSPGSVFMSSLKCDECRSNLRLKMASDEKLCALQRLGPNNQYHENVN